MSLISILHQFVKPVDVSRDLTREDVNFSSYLPSVGMLALRRLAYVKISLWDVFLFVDVQSFIPVLRAGFRSMERFPGFPLSEGTYQDFQSG